MNLRKERLSNFELLRIVAIFLVLVVHVDFFSLGHPTLRDAMESPLGVFSRYFFEIAAIVCVNVFVLISGWFSIRPSVKGFCNLFFTSMFFLYGVYLVMLLAGQESFDSGLKGLFHKLELNWFVKAYIVMYVLAPMMNVYTENTERNVQKYVLMTFFAIQTYYGWITGTAAYFSSGYSPLSFVFLYLLARYIRMFSPRWADRSTLTFLSAYFLLTLFMTAVCMIFIWKDSYVVQDRMIWYNNPLVILSALCLLLSFRRIEFRNRFVNWCANSCFSVFLLHTHPCLFGPYYKETVVWIYGNYSGGGFVLAIMLFLLTVFSVAVIIDQLRKLLWRRLASLCW